jgi:mutator family transposase
VKCRHILPRSTAPKCPARPSGTITDAVLEGMAEWQNRPLDRVYPVIFIDAIHVKIRDGQVANRPIYMALAVTVDGERDILAPVAGDGGEGAKYWLPRADRDQKPGHAGLLHPRLRRIERTTRRGGAGLAGHGCPNVHRAPVAQQLSVCQHQGLGGNRP